MTRPQPCATTRKRVARTSLTAVAALSALLLSTTGAFAAPVQPGDLPVAPCTTTPSTLARGVSLTCLPGVPTASNTHIVTVDLSRSGPTFDVVPANGTVAQYGRPGLPDQPVSEMTPSNAVVGINGGYFDINQNNEKSFTGQACGGMVSQGRIIKTPPREFGTGANLVVHRDGRMEVAVAGFAGTIQSPTGSTALTSINDISDAGPQQGCPPDLVRTASRGDGTTLVTPDMGALTLPAPGPKGGFDFRLTNAVVVHGLRFGDAVLVTQVESVPLLTSLPALTPFRVALLATGAQGTWLADHARRGTLLKVSGSLTVNGAPASDVTTLVSGGARILAGGTAITPASTPGCETPQTTPPNPPCGVFPTGGNHAETMVGISADGKRAYLVVVDDNIPPATGNAGGVSPMEDGTFLAGLGASDGVLFDGGGSSTMVARTAGGPLTVVNNTLTGDGPNNPAGPDNQRYVANALIVRPR